MTLPFQGKPKSKGKKECKKLSCLQMYKWMEKKYYVFRVEVIVANRSITEWVGMNEGVLIQSLSRDKGIKSFSKNYC